MLKYRGFDDIPREYLLDRWSKYATCRPIFNVVGTTLLADCMSIENHQSKISELWSEVFTSVSLDEDNEELGDKLLELLRGFNEKLMISVKRGKSKNKKAEIEMLICSKIPSEASVLPPEKCKNKGSGRRITSNKEKAVQENAKPLRKCRACGEMTHHAAVVYLHSRKSVSPQAMYQETHRCVFTQPVMCIHATTAIWVNRNLITE
ncbi:uncharacterized protein LOC141617589 [Silene latifolia]|uniref:uncharacterized protein LOC141617589 n=1 Tax=Silene latifolia TaxID=37657 RepID=UPI003D7712CD